MSRVPKWKIEKAKVKVVFRLQFHATNIPSTGWDKLFLSFISADTGKVSAKTNKANVRNGSCKWPDPIYEATRLLQDSRTKTYDDKLYKIVVAMGTSRSSILGEVDVNLAEFAEALKPASIALPLRGCEYGTILHVTAQLLTTKTGFREFEQQRENGARSTQQLVNQRSHDPAEVGLASSDIYSHKANARIKLKESSLGYPLVEDSAGSTEDYENSSHNSDGLFAEKIDPYGGHEVNSFRTTISGDLCPSSQSPTPEKGPFRSKHLSPQGSNDWSYGWSPEISSGHDLAAAHEENNQLRTRLEVAESAFSQLKTEATSLQDVTDKLGTETHGFAQQLGVELMSRNQLSAEVSLLRTECSNLKRELQEMKSAKLLQQKADGEDNLMTTAGQGNTSTKFGTDILVDTSVHNLQTQWLQGLLLLESKLQQTRNNALHVLQAADLDFLLADLGALQRVIENLKQGVQIGQMKENHSLEHLVPPTNAAHQPSLGRDHDSNKKTSGSTGTMEEKMCELLQKLEDSKTEKENLLEKMSQMERYYESFIHKLEERQKQTELELENLRKEHNSCFYTVSVLQAQKQKMHEEMNDQLMRFVEDRTTLEAQNKDFERRAVATETSLKRVRWNYSAAVERLQKDLELLSFQVLSMYESNENLAKQSIIEDLESFPEEQSADLGANKERGLFISDPESQAFSGENGTPDNLTYKIDGQKSLLRALKMEEIRNRPEFQVLSNTNVLVDCSKIDKLEKTSSTTESEVLEMYGANIEWQVFSDVLREAHCTALGTIKLMQGRLHMLEIQLRDSNDAMDSLVHKLNSALDQAKSVKESEAEYILKCDDLMVKTQILEAKLQDMTVENALLMEKLTESERHVQEHKSCESKYKACDEDRNRFENLFMKESLQTSHLKDELRSLQFKDETLMHMENEIRGLQDDLRSSDENLLREKRLTEELQSTLSSLTSQLGQKDQALFSFDEHKTELNLLRDQVFDMEKANSLMQDSLSQSEQIQMDLNCKNISLQSQLSNIEDQLAAALKDKLATETEASYLRNLVEEINGQLDSLRYDLEKLQGKNKDADELLRVHMSTEAELADRIATLEVDIHSLEVDLARVHQEKEGLEELVERNKEQLAQVGTNKSRDIIELTDSSERVLKYQDDIFQLKVLLTNLEEQVDDLRSTKDEVEILNMVLRSKLEEKRTEISSLLQDSGHELANLKEQNKDLTQKLAEQTLKAEEFKNLSIHLRELKEKAEAGRKEKEGSLFAMQESLRIAFIKEQYETKVQELKGQVFVSKKYAEEMLLKLQTALDEVETARKNEISLAKRIEELSMKISEMELEMQDASADKREMSNAYDSIVTELECTKLNFDCCVEEKQKIEATLQECTEERNRIRVELDLIKKLLENMALTDNPTVPDKTGSCTSGATSIGQILGDAKPGSSSKTTKNITEVDSRLQQEEDRIQSTNVSSNLAAEEDVRRFSEQHEHAKSVPSRNLEKERESSLENHSTGKTAIKDISIEHRKLAVDLNHFQEELERLKNENLSPLLPLDNNLIDPSFSGLERALSQLDMANEHIRSIFPSFKELPGSGNALERVLALELELAEALQAKKKTDILFQSSFLKQHNDEAAVFQSFRDINELIQDTIELKRRHVAVETELKDMQGRYSELSVQFAEVEGERQKLEMNLKSRSPR